MTKWIYLTCPAFASAGWATCGCISPGPWFWNWCKWYQRASGNKYYGQKFFFYCISVSQKYKCVQIWLGEMRVLLSNYQDSLYQKQSFKTNTYILQAERFDWSLIIVLTDIKDLIAAETKYHLACYTIFKRNMEKTWCICNDDDIMMPWKGQELKTERVTSLNLIRPGSDIAN